MKTNEKYTISCARVYKSVSRQLRRCNLWSSVRHGAKFLRFDCFRRLLQRRCAVDCEFIGFSPLQLLQLSIIKTRIQCSTSDKNTCIEPFCHFERNGTGAVIANYGCKDLTKPLEHINVSWTASMNEQIKLRHLLLGALQSLPQDVLAILSSRLLSEIRLLRVHPEYGRAKLSLPGREVSQGAAAGQCARLPVYRLAASGQQSHADRQRLCLFAGGSIQSHLHILG